MKAFLLSAGFGTRLKPFTNHHPKALAQINGKSLLEINIRNLQRFGIFDIVVNVHHFADQIIETIQKEHGFGSNVEISEERTAILETGGGLKNAAPFFKNEESFVMMNVDIVSNFDLKKMLQHHNASSALATLAVQNRTSSRYFLFNQLMELCGWENIQTKEQKIPAFTNKENLTQKAFSGIQILESSIFEKIKFEGKFSIVDVYLDLCKQEKIMGWDHSGDILIDVGKPESLLEAQNVINWMD